MLAARGGHVEIVKVLILVGAYVNLMGVVSHWNQ